MAILLDLAVSLLRMTVLVMLLLLMMMISVLLLLTVLLLHLFTSSLHLLCSAPDLVPPSPARLLGLCVTVRLLPTPGFPGLLAAVDRCS
jgi:hypothetical protein